MTLNAAFPSSFAPASDGYLYAANGVDKVWKWDGTGSVPGPDAGLPSPTTAAVLAASGGSEPTAGEVVSSGISSPLQLAYHESSNLIYFTNFGGSPYARYIDIDDSHSVNTFVTGASDWTGVCVDDSDTDTLFWSDQTDFIGRYVISTETFDADTYTSSSSMRSIAQYQGNIYFHTNTSIIQVSEGGSSGANLSTTPASASQYAIYTDYVNGRLYYTTAAGTIAYWDFLDAAETVLSKTGTTGTIDAIAVDGNKGVIYASDDNGIVYWRAENNGATRLVTTSSKALLGMCITEDYLYYSNFTDSTISRVPLIDPTTPTNRTYDAYVRFGDGNGNWGAVGPLSNTVTTSGNSFSYSSVPTTADTRVSAKQILRRTSGQSSIYYVDAEPAVAATTASSTKSDSELETQEAVSVYSSTGANLVSGFTEPPSDRRFIVHHQGRMFLAGETVYSRGSVVMTNSSASVTGVETYWQDELEGRFFRVLGGTTQYDVDTVGSATSITLGSSFSGSSGLYEYEIKSTTATRNLVYWSRASNFGQWDVGAALAFGDPNKPITAMFSHSGILYVAQSDILHRFVYNENPGDGRRFDAAFRGCVSQRCVGELDGSIFLLDRAGPWIFDGKTAVTQVADSVSGIFRSRTNDRTPRVNWAARERFHLVIDDAERIARWFVCLGQDPYPKHAICLQVDDVDWWIEEYPDFIGASCQSPDSQGLPLLGTQTLSRLTTNATDYIRPDDGKQRWKVAKGTLLTAEVNPGHGDLPSQSAGSSITIASGRGAGQTRLISEQRANVFVVQIPWNIIPDETSTVQIAGIPWKWRSGRMRLDRTDQAMGQHIDVTYRPTKKDGSFFVRPIYNLDDEPEEINGMKTGDEASTTEGGLHRTEISAPRTREGMSSDTIKVELDGVSNSERTRIYEVEVFGTEAEPLQR